MKLLAIETSGTLCGAAILEDEKLIDKIELENGLTHSQNLMPIIKDLLEKNSFKISDFETFVCDIGPGSFTGIRIGVATVKAFIDSLENVKYTGVSSLEALAYNINKEGLICSVIDCKNDNCYFALYEFKNNNYTELISPTSASISEMKEKLKSYSNITFVGDGATNNLNKINITNLGIAGYKKISNNNTLELLPMYLKKPQAQKQLEEKEGLNNGN